MPSTYTLCFCGTDTWRDESLANRKGSGGSDPAIYGRSGYIPVKIFDSMQAPPPGQLRVLKAVVPGPGAPYMAEWSTLWVQSTIWNPLPAGDTALGGSMWDLAGHGAARAVGMKSSGRIKSGDLAREAQNEAYVQNARAALLQLGFDLTPDNVWAPPSNGRYRFDADSLDELVRRARVRQPDGPIQTINLIGHSRGAVAAIMCSHELSALFPTATINIFAIDPVPGGGKTLSMEETYLGRNVRNFVGVYAADEVTPGFNAVVPRPSYQGGYIDPIADVGSLQHQIRVPNYHLVWTPGRHGTIAGNGTSNGKDTETSVVGAPFEKVGLMVDRLARACLRRWGSAVPDIAVPAGQPPLPTLQELRGAMDRNADVAAQLRAMRAFTYLPGDTGSSWTHYAERGITASMEQDAGDWRYLEDAIGLQVNGSFQPLVARAPSRFFPPEQSGPGQIMWRGIHELPDRVFTSEAVNDDINWETQE